MTALAWVVTRADAPIEARGTVSDAIAEARRGATISDGPGATEGRLPLFDAPCNGSKVRGRSDLSDPDFAGAIYQVCQLEGWDVGVRLDLATAHPAAGLYPFPGPVLAGGPLGLGQGLLLYPDDGGLRWTTSHRRARELSRSALMQGLLGRGPEAMEAVPQLAFGHAGWAQGQLASEIEAGAWEVVP